MTLSWAAPASDGGAAITEYEYRYSEGAAVDANATWTDVTDGSDDGDSTADETGVTVSSLTNGTQYAFEVRAVNSVGDGTAAGPVTATPADGLDRGGLSEGGALRSPTGVPAISAGNATVDLSCRGAGERRRRRRSPDTSTAMRRAPTVPPDTVEVVDRRGGRQR